MKKTVIRSARRGLNAASENMLPGLALLSAMALIVLGYYYWPASGPIFESIRRWQEEGGVLFACISNGIAAGLLSEIAKVYTLQHGRWTAKNREEMAFKFGIYFVGAFFTFNFYRLQARWFGLDPSPGVVLSKVAVDMLVYSPLWSVPYYTTVNLWKSNGYSFKRLRRNLRLVYFLDHYLPQQISCWVFWIPGTLLVYSMPLVLQMPLVIFANAFWALMVLSIARHDPDETAPAH